METTLHHPMVLREPSFNGREARGLESVRVTAFTSHKTAFIPAGHVLCVNRSRASPMARGARTGSGEVHLKAAACVPYHFSNSHFARIGSHWLGSQGEKTFLKSRILVNTSRASSAAEGSRRVHARLCPSDAENGTGRLLLWKCWPCLKDTACHRKPGRPAPGSAVQIEQHCVLSPRVMAPIEFSPGRKCKVSGPFPGSQPPASKNKPLIHGNVTRARPSPSSPGACHSLIRFFSLPSGGGGGSHDSPGVYNALATLHH